MERRELIETLLRRKAEHAWQDCAEVAFRILYGLPAKTQLNLAKLALQRYLEIFKRKWPAIVWPAQLLSDIDGWFTGHGRSVPSEPGDPDPADAAFLFSFDALLLAAAHPDNQLILTSSCMASVSAAISARQCNVWMADDPEGVEMWKRQDYFPGRSVGENRAAIAVAEREWGEIAQWLKNEEVWRHPNAFTIDEIETALAEWKEHEMLLIPPRSSKYK